MALRKEVCSHNFPQNLRQIDIQGEKPSEPK